MATSPWCSSGNAKSHVLIAYIILEISYFSMKTECLKYILRNDAWPPPRDVPWVTLRAMQSIIPTLA